jgi:hypothetical protein
LRLKTSTAVDPVPHIRSWHAQQQHHIYLPDTTKWYMKYALKYLLLWFLEAGRETPSRSSGISPVLFMRKEWIQFAVVAYDMSQYNLWLVSRHSFLPSLRYTCIIQQRH